MERKTLFLFCNIGSMNDSHINDVGFSHSSAKRNSVLKQLPPMFKDLNCQYDFVTNVKKTS